jgi:peptide/nickel transport system permease protein
LTTIRRLSTNRLATLGGIAIVFILFVAILAPILAPHDPTQVHPLARFEPPGSPGHLLGTDEVGRDVLSRVIYGARVSLLVAGLAVGGATLFGGIVGVLSGYLGGWFDGVFMRIVDVLFAIPTIMIALSVIGLFGRSTGAIVFALTVGYLPLFARVSYSATVSVREHAFVESSLALGSSATRILRQDILPNIFPLLVVQVTTYVARAILAEATLGFLGLGVQPPTPTWGEMLSSSRNYFGHSLTLPLWPGLAVMLTVFAFNLFGDGLRDVLDPRAWQVGD